MTDIALILPANHASNPPRTGAKLLVGALRSACTYLAFAFSVAFTFAVVIGFI
jgi:hypothetical protein